MAFTSIFRQWVFPYGDTDFAYIQLHTYRYIHTLHRYLHTYTNRSQKSSKYVYEVPVPVGSDKDLPVSEVGRDGQTGSKYGISLQRIQE